MNAKQRKQHKKRYDKIYMRIAEGLIDTLRDIADDLESGQLTHEQLIKEIRQAQEGWRELKR